MSRGAHLDEDCLFEAGLSEQWGEPPSPPVSLHLQSCHACRARYAEIVCALTQSREDAAQEADILFTSEHLHQQQEQILRRLEHLSRPARVISFPGRALRPTAGGANRLAPRWLAAAAVAGLFVGVAVGGHVAGWRRPASAPGLRIAGATPRPQLAAPAPAVLVSQPSGEAFDDENFLKELEFALERPRTRELLPFDALTPHVRETVSQVQ